MLISDQKQFIFIHIEKTGGSSIGSVLQAYANPVPKSPLSSALKHLGLPRDYRKFHFGQHEPLSLAEAHMPQHLFESYLKVAFVRNPWDRLVSEYNAAVRKNRRRRHRRIAAFEKFEDFVRYEIRRNKFFQYPRLLKRDGTPGVDFIGRFESMAEDYEQLRGMLKIDDTLPHLNAHPHADYREYYTETGRRLVAEAWAQEIEYLDYRF